MLNVSFNGFRQFKVEFLAKRLNATIICICLENELILFAFCYFKTDHDFFLPNAL